MRRSAIPIATILPFLLTILVAACGSHKSGDGNETVCDWDSIKARGELRVLTLYSSTSYFFYKGEERGYEYELIKRFADDNGLSTTVIVADNITHLTEMLLNGEGDVIAYEVPVTGDTKKNMIHCGPEVVSYQVLVQSTRNKPLVANVTDLVGKEVYVERGSKYEERINNLNEELGGGIHIHCINRDTVVTEDLIEMVSKGEIPYTLADENLARLNRTYYPNINIALAVSFPQRSQWAVRSDAPHLAAEIDSWVEANGTSEGYKAISKRYFEQEKRASSRVILSVEKGRISKYDGIFKRIAKETGWDWRMLAAIAYHESRFDTSVVSWAGARGLMQLMPGTAAAFGLSADSIAFPEPNVRAAAKSLVSVEKSFADIDNEHEKMCFILASYNAGLGHVYDAVALAKKYNLQPRVWTGEVENAMLMKANPEYFNDEVCRFGYLRGRQTVSYVREVMALYKLYCEKIPE